MSYIGSIIGDIIGSQYEFDRPENLDWKHCSLLTDDCFFTDDTVMTLAIKSAIDNKKDYQEEMRRIGRNYPICGYGESFFTWIYCAEPKPYNSYGNGSAMRISYIADYYDNLEDVMREAEKSAIVSHNHPEGIKGAVCMAELDWMAKNGSSKDEIYRKLIQMYPHSEYKYSELTIDELKDVYFEDISCMSGIPAAGRCFFEANSYEEFMRNIFRFENDSDTFGAIFGSIAEYVFGGTGLDNQKILDEYLDDRLKTIIN